MSVSLTAICLSVGAAGYAEESVKAQPLSMKEHLFPAQSQQLPAQLQQLPAQSQPLPAQSQQLPAQSQPLASNVLRNIDYMPRLHTLEPPARPHKILRWHHSQVQQDQDEKIMRLLLVTVGLAGIIIAILVMRSMPGKRQNQQQTAPSKAE